MTIVLAAKDCGGSKICVQLRFPGYLDDDLERLLYDRVVVNTVD